MAKDLNYYLGLNYPVTLVKEERGYSVAVLDLPGCLSQGGTAEEALENVEDAKATWLEVALSKGREIPEPWTKRRTGPAAEGNRAAMIEARTLLRDLQGCTSKEEYVEMLAAALAGRKE